MSLLDPATPAIGPNLALGPILSRHCRPLLATGLLVAMSALTGCQQPPPAGEPVRAVRTLTVGDQAAPVVRDYAGEIRARIETPLGFRVPGKIVRRQVELGQRVQAGQVLAQIDPADLRYGADAASAALQAAQVNFDQTATDYKRYEDLRAQGFISAADLERRHSGLAAARAQLDQARAQAGVQANQAAYASLPADAGGVVTAVYTDVGAVVAAGTPVLALAHDGPRDIVFAIPEDQLPVVRGLVGKADGVRVSLWSGASAVSATVREVAAAADPASRTFQVKADIPPGAADLGQTATVHVQLAPADGLLRLPLSAVAGRLGPDGASRSVVWVLDTRTMQVSERDVKVVRPEGDALVIGSGLAKGDVVVTAGAHVLNPGQKVAYYQEAPVR